VKVPPTERSIAKKFRAAFAELAELYPTDSTTCLQILQAAGGQMFAFNVTPGHVADIRYPGDPQ
jgi:hypothetical protein